MLIVSPKKGFRFQYASWALSLFLGMGTVSPTLAEPGRLGLFEGHVDVGKVEQPGSAEFLAPQQEYRLTAAGENVWGTADAFHFAWRKVSGI